MIHKLNTDMKMKKLCILNGSPRKKGNTWYLSELLIEKLNKEVISVNSLFIYDYDIKPCIDCRYCKKGSLECFMKDDNMPLIYNFLENSEILVFATPIYWCGPTAKMKLLIDRLRPYYVNKKLAGKRAALLMPAADGKKDTDLTIEMFKRIFAGLGIEYIDQISVEAYDIGDAKKNNDILPEISGMAEKINLLSA
jgi:multimeric flavodoxin WrbA